MDEDIQNYSPNVMFRETPCMIFRFRKLKLFYRCDPKKTGLEFLSPAFIIQDAFKSCFERFKGIEFLPQTLIF